MVISVSVMLFPVVESTLKMYNVVGMVPLVFIWIPSGSMKCPEGVLWFSKAVLMIESCMSRGILLVQYQGRRSHFSRENGISILWVSGCECETTSNQELVRGLGDLYVLELFV